MFLEPALPWVLRGPGDSSDSRLLGQRARDLGRSVNLLGILVRRLSLLRITETIPTPGFYPNPEHSRSRWPGGVRGIALGVHRGRTPSGKQWVLGVPGSWVILLSMGLAAAHLDGD